VKDEMIHVPQGDRPKVFSHPSRIMVAGATQSGKTTLVLNMLKHIDTLMDPPPEKIYWFYTMPASVAGVPDILPHVKLRHGAPSEDVINNIIKDGKPKLIVMDDMQDLILDKKQAPLMKDIFTKISHHGNLSVLLIVQNLFLKDLIRLREQCDQVIVMGNGVSAAANCVKLGMVMCMKNYLRECMDKVRAHGVSHPYILVSSDAKALPFDVRSGIIPGDAHQLLFAAAGRVTTPEYVRLKKHAEKQERQKEEEGRRPQVVHPSTG
jgi:energy-coupling factor transporter ATP-binding protein EcfA2